MEDVFDGDILGRLAMEDDLPFAEFVREQFPFFLVVSFGVDVNVLSPDAVRYGPAGRPVLGPALFGSVLALLMIGVKLFIGLPVCLFLFRADTQFAEVEGKLRRVK